KFRFSSELEDHQNALEGFQVLGPAAKPAIPVLNKLLLHSNTSEYATFALVRIGPSSSATFCDAFMSKEPWVRRNAARGLGLLHVWPSVRWSDQPVDPDEDQRTIVPLLTKYITDRDWR